MWMYSQVYLEIYQQRLTYEYSYYNSVIMDLRTRYQNEFENDKDFVVKKKRIKSTATVGGVFDQ